eukprot:403354457
MNNQHQSTHNNTNQQRSSFVQTILIIFNFIPETHFCRCLCAATLRDTDPVTANSLFMIKTLNLKLQEEDKTHIPLPQLLLEIDLEAKMILGIIEGCLISQVKSQRIKSKQMEKNSKIELTQKAVCSNTLLVSTKSSMNQHPVKAMGSSTATDYFNNTLGNVNTFDIIPETPVEQAYSNTGSNFDLEAI